MTFWRIYVVLSIKGFQDLLTSFEELLLGCMRDDLPGSNNRIALLVPPSFINKDELSNSSDDDAFDDVLKYFYSWMPQQRLIKSFDLVLLKSLIIFSETDEGDVVTKLPEDDVDLLSDCIHQLADELFIPGNFLQTFIFTGGEDLNSGYTNLVGALKRLEIWHHAFIGIVSNSNEENVQDYHKGWRDIINVEMLSLSEFRQIHLSTSIWNGSLNILLEKRSGYIPIRHCFLQTENKEQEGLFHKNVLGFNPESSTDGYFVFGNHIEVVACVQQEDIPFHMVLPQKYKLFSFSDIQSKFNENVDFFELCARNKGSWLMAFLKYGKKKNTNHFTKEDWYNYISQDFTHYLCTDYSSIDLRRHSVMFLRCAEDDVKTLDAYFVYNKLHYNSRGFVKLLDLVENVDGPIDDSSNINDGFTFCSNAAEHLRCEDWCEKEALYLEETMYNTGKSLYRWKSDDFFMNGVPIIQSDSSKDDSNVIFPKLVALFDVDGKALDKNLHPVPVISDRLLKNLKTEDRVRTMSYKEAEKEIGHGIDYCLDSICALRLDNRLTKIQKRYVPEETLNLATFIESSDDAKIHCSTADSSKGVTTKRKGIKRNSSEAALDQSTVNNVIPLKKESRSQKNLRRLRTLVNGVVYKYGGVEKDDEAYDEHCERLFQICVKELKKLTSSTGLNEQMKRLAKDNLHKVVDPIT